MKFLSIFSLRGFYDDAPPRDLEASAAARAAALFGVPESQLTPQVRAAFNAMMGEVDELRREIDHLKVALSDAEAAADYDPLVSTYNRRAFMREASRVAAMVRRHEVEASLIFFDLDGFKMVNDLHGHAAGDMVLRAVGETLVRQTRESDVVGRIGGDEFAVVLTHVDPEAARLKADALAAAICSERIRWEGITLSIDVSYGVCRFLQDDTSEQVLARADEAMYQEKHFHRAARA
ncbi:diguanylate cyclase [bacterium]|nr:diguanylate cyclase [bacterium]